MCRKPTELDGELGDYRRTGTNGIDGGNLCTGAQEHVIDG